MAPSTGQTKFSGPEINQAIIAMVIIGSMKGSQYVSDVRVMAALAIVAAVVPPPFGLVTAGAMAGVYGFGKYLTRHAMHAFREFKGYAQPGDFDILGQYNRLADQAYRVTVPVKRPALVLSQKSVFPAVEMR